VSSCLRGRGLLGTNWNFGHGGVIREVVLGGAGVVVKKRIMTHKGKKGGMKGPKWRERKKNKKN